MSSERARGSSNLSIPAPSEANGIARDISRKSVSQIANEARKSIREGRLPEYKSIEAQEDGLPEHGMNPQVQRSKCCAAWHFVMGNLTIKTLLGVLLGFILGASLREADPSEQTEQIIAYPGELFVSALKMVVIPLIAVGMVLAVIKLGDIAKLKRIGSRALLYYCGTTFLAAVIGLIMVNIFNPGKGIDEVAGELNCIDGATAFCQSVNSTPAYYTNCTKTFGMLCEKVDIQKKETLDAFLDIGRTMLPSNLFVAFSTTNILGIIVFCLLFGFMLTKENPADVAVVQQFFNATNGALMRMVEMLIWWTPIGIFSLVAGEVLKAKDLWGDLAKLGLFVVTVMCGIFFHALVVYPSIYFCNTRNNPCTFFKQLLAPVLTAFATSSSAATLPVTINAVEQAGVHPDISRFILPLGATINMDGTAIYFPIAVIFLANWQGFALTAGQQISISVVSAFVSIGAAPIPSAGLVYLLLIMNSVGIPVSGNISLVLAIDWFLDRLQTCCNVCGDSFGSAILNHMRQKDIAAGIISDEDGYLADETPLADAKVEE